MDANNGSDVCFDNDANVYQFCECKCCNNVQKKQCMLKAHTYIQ